VSEAGTSGREPQHDAVVVGSGFGGSISTLRLAESGRSVLVLERGRRYRPGEFPRDVRDAPRLFWQYPERPAFRGLFDVRFFSALGAVVASGVGGGSLIYANIHIRPGPDVFDDPRWPRSITRQRLDPYYDRVARALGVAPVPAGLALAKRDAYREAAARLGKEIFDPDQAVAWSAAAGPGREACCLCTQCEFGCQHGAKNTLDLTYLAEAERLGARVVPGRHVTFIEPAGTGYRVHYTEVDSGARGSVVGARVVLAAGTLGTNEMLLRSRDVARTLPGLSPRLGHGYSANGDFLGSIQNVRLDLQPWHGPDVTSVIRYPDPALPFTMAAPTFNREVMEVLASLGQAQGGVFGLAAPMWPLLGRLLPWAFERGLLSRPSRLPARNAGDPARMTNLFAIGRDNANGRIRLEKGRLDVEWDYARENRALIERMMAAMREIAEIYGGTFAPIVSWTVFKRIITVHSLGGCHLSDSPETGVVSPRGEVHGYPRLFVADGSVVPTAIGFHPAMTIAALSEHIAEAVVASYP
jgi:cholesterol oxidase